MTIYSFPFWRNFCFKSLKGLSNDFFKHHDVWSNYVEDMSCPHFWCCIYSAKVLQWFIILWKNIVSSFLILYDIINVFFLYKHNFYMDYQANCENCASPWNGLSSIFIGYLILSWNIVMFSFIVFWIVFLKWIYKQVW